MSDIIERYVLVDEDNHEEDHEYTDYMEALHEAERRKTVAIIARTYRFQDSNLVWVPTSLFTWPPKTKLRPFMTMKSELQEALTMIDEEGDLSGVIPKLEKATGIAKSLVIDARYAEVRDQLKRRVAP